MKIGVSAFIHVLMACFFIQFAQAAEPDTNSGSTSVQDSKAHIKALQEELAEAKIRVSELETELNNAQHTIEQLENQHANQAADVILVKESGQAVTQTVRGQPLFDEYNPRAPVKQKNVIVDKYTTQIQSEPVAVTSLLEDDLVRSRIRNITRIADQVPQYAVRTIGQ